MTASEPADDSYRHWDAAYVLGALSPAERREFEEHLAGCGGCQQAVSEVTDIPALLSLVQPLAAIQTPAGDQEVLDIEPSHPVSSLPAAGAARSRRRTVWLGAVAAALVLLVGGIGIALASGALPLGQPESYRVAFTQVTPNAMTAVVDVIPHDSGTTLKVECQYGSQSESPYARVQGDYAIYVIDRTGNQTLAKVWRARPDRQMRPTAELPLPVRKIVAVEIWRAGPEQQPLLRATLR